MDTGGCSTKKKLFLAFKEKSLFVGFCRDVHAHESENIICFSVNIYVHYYVFIYYHYYQPLGALYMYISAFCYLDPFHI